MEAIFYNPLDPEVHADPYPHYRLLREQDPIHRSPLGFWVLSRHTDIAPLLRDPRLGHELTSGEAGDFLGAEGASMLFRDPPAHTRLRALVSKAFTPRMLERLRPPHLPHRRRRLGDGQADRADRRNRRHRLPAARHGDQ